MQPDGRKHLDLARDLRLQADALLAETGLMTILSRYGEVFPTGSYSYDLMTWRDIDLCLATQVDRVLEPGRKLIDRLTGETREMILRIKNVVCQRPGYRQEYGSSAIYRAVVEHNIGSVEEWDQWWATQKK